MVLASGRVSCEGRPVRRGFSSSSCPLSFALGGPPSGPGPSLPSRIRIPKGVFQPTYAGIPLFSLSRPGALRLGAGGAAPSSSPSLQGLPSPEGNVHRETRTSNLVSTVSRGLRNRHRPVFTKKKKISCFTSPCHSFSL